MPDHLAHHEQVPEVRVARGHESGQDVERAAVADRLRDRPVVPVADDDPAPHERGHLGEKVEQGLDGLDPEVVEEASRINRLAGGPGVECFLHGWSHSLMRANSTKKMPSVCTQPKSIFFFTEWASRTEREMTDMGRAVPPGRAWTSISEWVFAAPYTR